MRRLAEFFFQTNIQKSTRRAGMKVAILSLLACTLFTFSTLAHAQTTIITSDFEDGQPDGWTQNGTPTTFAASTDMAHSGTQSLKLAGRSNGWDGAAMNFLPIMKPGEAWEFSVWVRLAPGMAPTSKLNLTMRDPQDTSGWGGYPVVANADGAVVVTDQAWVQLKGRYPGSGTLNPGGDTLNLYFSAPSGIDFYVDDFLAWKQSPTGCYATPDTTGDSSDFESSMNWIPRGWSGVTLTLTTADKHSGSQSLLQSTRGDTWKTASTIETGKMCSGSSYNVSAWVKMAPGMPATQMRLQAIATKSGSDSYLALTPVATVTDQAWVQLKGKYDMWNSYDVLQVFVDPGTDKTSSFYVDDYSLTYVPQNQAVENITGIGTAFAFPVGAAVSGPDVTAGDVHADLLAKHFTSVTPENDMKWSATEPTEGNFDYTKAQAIVDFAKANGMAVRGHTLVWDQQTPDWVFQDPADSTKPASKTLLQDRMKAHIQALITHFGADVTSWDVVNEAFDESQTDGFRRGKWYTTYGGPGYIDDAFKYAHDALVSAGLTGKVKLYLNDYNTTVPAKLGFITSYLTAAKTAGVPIDGVGHQFHNKLDWPVNDDPTSITSVTNAINAVAALGFDNQITEMEISIYRNLAAGQTQTTYQSYLDILANMQNDLVIQGYRYRDYFGAFKTLAAANKLSSVTLWGQADDHTWLTSSSKADAPLPFDKTLTHKPAYTGIMDATALPNALPHAYDAAVKVSFNTALVITLPGSDADQNTLTFTIGTQPTHGTLSAAAGNKVTYTPATGYYGPDSFTYTANDGKGDSNVGTISVTVQPAPPVAADQTVQVGVNTPKTITLVATGDGTMTYTVLTQPAHGVLSGTAPDLTYTPATDYSGPDSFTFQANNSLDSNVATVSLNVVLDPPVAADQSVTTDLNTAKAITISATGQGTITYSVVAQPAHGALSGTAPALTYTPTTGYWGSDSFTFKATNGTDSNVAKVSITVLPAPAVALDQAITVEYNTPTQIKLTATGNGTMTYTIVSFPEGTLTPTAGDSSTWTYTNKLDKDPYMNKPPYTIDQDKVTFRVNNGHDSAIATVSITINPAALKVNMAAGEVTSKTINAGESATFNMKVAGFMAYSTKENPQVSFLCGGIPNNARCTFTPNLVSLDDNMTPVPFSVTIHTNGAAAAAASTSMPGSMSGMPLIATFALGSFVLIVIMTSKTKMQWRLVGASAALLIAMTFTGCGGKNAANANSELGLASPAGTYNVQVTALASHNLSGVQQTDWKIIGQIPVTLTVK